MAVLNLHPLLENLVVVRGTLAANILGTTLLGLFHTLLDTQPAGGQGHLWLAAATDGFCGKFCRRVKNEMNG